MLDLPGHSFVDKSQLVGGCARLSLRVDADRLHNEYQQIPLALWGTTGGRVGVHSAADAIFLRGYAPAEGDKPIADREALTHVPYMRSIIEDLIPAPPLRCLLARLPAGASIAPHIDRAPYFGKSLRIHIPVESHDNAWMMSANLYYRMRAGEVWALNNSATHAVWNTDASRSRTHLICDFLPAPELLHLLGQAEKNLGMDVPPFALKFEASLTNT